MGFLDSIKSGISSVSNKVSETVDKVENKVSSAVSSAEQTVQTVENKAVDFAKSEFKQATDYAKATGQKVEHAASAVIDKAKSVPLGNPLTAGKKLLEQLEGKKTSADSVEGEGGVTSKPNGGDPNQVVDLGSPDKIKDFLNTYGQRDKTDATNSDGARCQSNVMVAGLLLKGGVPALQKGLENAKADAQEQLKTATGGKKIALENALKEYDEALGGLKSGKPTRGQLDKAADALFHTMAQPSVYDAKGAPTADGVEGSRISQMEKTVGLTQGQGPADVGEYKWYNPMQLYYDNNEEVANKVFDSIPNGGTAHVGVNLYGEALAKSAGPNGEPILKSQAGELYYLPKGAADDPSNRVYINLKKNDSGAMVQRGIDHAVLFGKNADGTRFIYNPNGDPPMISEKKGDKASSKALDQMAADLIARQKTGKITDDYGAKVTNY